MDLANIDEDDGKSDEDGRLTIGLDILFLRGNIFSKNVASLDLMIILFNIEEIS